MRKLKKGVLRVAVMNNFNFTAQEFDALKQYEEEWLIFVNTCSSQTISGHLPVIITLNQYLTEFIEPKGDLSLIKVVRVKYTVDGNEKVMKAFDDSVAWAKAWDIPVLVTFMRFRTRKQLLTYSKSELKYKFKNNYFRPSIAKLPDNELHYCDFDKKGCPECKNCAKLTYGVDTNFIYGINLSASGVCTYNCPSCFAGYMVKMMKGKMRFDTITQNRKQLGVL
jgi:hypothetical protein